MNRRRQLAALLSVQCLILSPGFAQSLPVVGYLDPYRAEASSASRNAFIRGMEDHGWTEGRNYRLEYRATNGTPARYAALAGELVARNVSVIITGGEPLIQAARNATPVIPIVMATVGDPVGAGFAANLSRPGGNVTGMSNFAVGLIGKWNELLHEMAPRIKRVAILRNATNPTHRQFEVEARTSANRLGLTPIVVSYQGAEDLDAAFEKIVRERAGAVLLLPDPVVVSRSDRMAAACLTQRLPCVHLSREGVAEGGLLSYGPSRTDNYRRAAGYVDKILRGAKPGDLPIEQPVRFELVINLKTAAMIGIAVPSAMRMRADELL